MASQFVSVPFTNNVQEETFWCWAAAAANVFNSMLPPGSPDVVQQCDVVKLREGGDPCQNKDAYNAPDAVSNAFSDLNIRDGYPIGPSFQVIFDELSGLDRQTGETKPELAEPVCAEVDFGQAAHVVAISAALVDDQGTQHVWVEDPWPGAGNSIEHTYDDFVSNYSYKGGDGSTGVVSILQRAVRL